MDSKAITAWVARQKKQTPEEFRREVEKARRELEGLPPLPDDEASPQPSEPDSPEGEGSVGNLTPRQLRAVDLLLAGHPLGQIAEMLKVHSCTIHEWRKLPEFKAEIARRRDRLAGVEVRLADGVSEAVRLLSEVVVGQVKGCSPATRVQAAKALLSAGRHLPTGVQGTKEKGETP